MSRFLNKNMACALLGVSSSTLKRYQRTHWLEGIHFVRLNSRNIRYNEELLKDWMQSFQGGANHHKAHQRAIERYQASLNNNRKRSKRRS